MRRSSLLFAALALALVACDRRPPSDDDDDSAVSDDDSAVSDDDDTPTGAPSAPGVSVTPTEPAPGDALSCDVTTPSVDPEGGEVAYAYGWLRDGEAAELDQDWVDEGVTNGGEVWTCVVVPSVDERVGEPGQASVTVAFENRAPSAPTVAVRPATPRDNDPLECEVVTEGSDPDGDELSTRFEWYLGGNLAATGPQVPATTTAEGETWTCRGIHSDGTIDSLPGEASALIGPGAWTADVTNQGVDYFASSCFACPQETWYIPDHAFDDTTCTGTCSWHTTWTGGPEWVGVEFGKGNSKTITRYGLMGAAFHQGYRAVDWTLQGSHDNATWTVLHSVVGANLAYVMWGTEPFTYYELDNTTPYAFYRVHVTANAGGQQFADEVGIVEIEMFENAP